MVLDHGDVQNEPKQNKIQVSNQIGTIQLFLLVNWFVSNNSLHKNLNIGIVDNIAKALYKILFNFIPPFELPYFKIYYYYSEKPSTIT